MKISAGREAGPEAPAVSQSACWRRLRCVIIHAAMNEKSYAEQMARLTARKNAQTREKLSKLGFRDEDDYGLVLPPDVHAG